MQINLVLIRSKGMGRKDRMELSGPLCALPRVSAVSELSTKYEQKVVSGEVSVSPTRQVVLLASLCFCCGKHYYPGFSERAESHELWNSPAKGPVS